MECAPGPGTVWRKATASTSNGHCVEVAGWQASSHSVGNGACVQVARGSKPGYSAPVETSPRGVYVRDSKDPDGPVLAFAAADWQAFVDGLKTRPLEVPA